jgi:hypothetical protein
MCNPETAMSPRRRFANLAALAALATLTAACFSDTDPGWFAGAVAPPAKGKVVSVVPRVSDSGVSGRVIVEYDMSPALLTVSFYFAGVERNNVGARYAVHIHSGLDCGGVGVPVTHDLGAPASSIADYDIPSVWIYSTPLPIQHLGPGYYLDVHAPNDPTGLPLACAVF